VIEAILSLLLPSMSSPPFSVTLLPSRRVVVHSHLFLALWTLDTARCFDVLTRTEVSGAALFV